MWAGLSPVMHAAAWSTSPAADPAVTSAASAPSIRAMASPAASLTVEAHQDLRGLAHGLDGLRAHQGAPVTRGRAGSVDDWPHAELGVDFGNRFRDRHDRSFPRRRATRYSGPRADRATVPLPAGTPRAAGRRAGAMAMRGDQPRGRAARLAESGAPPRAWTPQPLEQRAGNELAAQAHDPLGRPRPRGGGPAEVAGAAGYDVLEATGTPRERGAKVHPRGRQPLGQVRRTRSGRRASIRAVSSSPECHSRSGLGLRMSARMREFTIGEEEPRQG